MSLDALKSEIATKRKANGEGPRTSKYLRRGEVEKLKQEQERMEHEEKEQQRRKLEEEKREAAEAKARMKVSFCSICTYHNLCLY